MPALLPRSPLENGGEMTGTITDCPTTASPPSFTSFPLSPCFLRGPRKIFSSSSPPSASAASASVASVAVGGERAQNDK